MSGIRVLIPPDPDAAAVEVAGSVDIPYAHLHAEDQEVVWDHSAEAVFAEGAFFPEGWCEDAGPYDEGVPVSGVRVTPVDQVSDGERTSIGQQCYLVELVTPPAYPPASVRLQMRRKGYR